MCANLGHVNNDVAYLARGASIDWNVADMCFSKLKPVPVEKMRKASVRDGDKDDEDDNKHTETTG